MKRPEEDNLMVLEQLDRERTAGCYQRLETVLVVEDHPELNEALSLRLERAGLNVARAHDGIEALEKVRLLEPDLILLDIHLPRLHGFRLLERLRRLAVDDIPILAMTGDPDPQVEERVERWGIRRFLRKPVDQRALVDTVLDVLEGYE